MNFTTAWEGAIHEPSRSHKGWPVPISTQFYKATPQGFCERYLLLGNSFYKSNLSSSDCGWSPSLSFPLSTLTKACFYAKDLTILSQVLREIACHIWTPRLTPWHLSQFLGQLSTRGQFEWEYTRWECSKLPMKGDTARLASLLPISLQLLQNSLSYPTNLPTII